MAVQSSWQPCCGVVGKGGKAVMVLGGVMVAGVVVVVVMETMAHGMSVFVPPLLWWW